MNILKYTKKALCIMATLTGLMALHSTSASAATQKPADFTRWKEVKTFINEMSEKHGFEKQTLEILFSEVKHDSQTIKKMLPATTSKAKDWQSYRARFVDANRIGAGTAFWDVYEDTLARAEQVYGVPAEIIVGIIGVETIFGNYTGKHRVIDALTTLAFDYPNAPNKAARSKYFRGEVENFLLYTSNNELDPFSIYGSYAGAIGWPQFMPGSIRAYAVDFDGNGKVDLINSPVDAIGSVANYLVKHGWKSGLPTVIRAKVKDTPESYWPYMLNQGLQAKYDAAQIIAADVTPESPLPAGAMFGLMELQNANKANEFFIGTQNFFAITKYNRSYFYAMSVIDLGNEVKAMRGK